MAELSSKALANFSAATSALILTESLRLIRNYRYYNDLTDNTVSRDQLISNIRNARKQSFVLQNLMAKNEPDEAPFFVSVAGLINDLLEEVHRKILFYDADDIVDIVPLIDWQRKFWKKFNQVEFYDSELIQKLEHTVPETFIRIEENIKNLPPFAAE